MSEIIQCPSCQRELQLPEEFIGVPVKCPACGLGFLTQRQPVPEQLPRTGEIPAQPSAAPPQAPPTLFPAPASYPQMPPAAPQRDVKMLVFPPAVCMLLVAILAVFVDGFGVIAVTMHWPPNVNKTLMELEQESPGVGAVALISHAVCLLSALITIAGALQMMRERTWGFAFAACILSMINFANCCCVLGLPAGAWGLIILIQPDVRATFR